MNEVFLSAGVPVVGRGDYHETADLELIQRAIEEFVDTTLGRMRIVWGGQPEITHEISESCEKLGVQYSNAVVLYQSKYFEGSYPEDNQKFTNIEYVDEVPGDRDASLERMREAMLSRPNLSAAVFIGGMNGVIEEHAIFLKHHPNATVVPVASPGGAAQQLAQTLGVPSSELSTTEFATLLQTKLGISPNAPRTL